MDSQLKQRLVGAAVLVSLGVIFIPVLLDGAGYKSRHERSIEIPEKPSFAPLTKLQIPKVKTPVEIRKERKKVEASQEKKTANEKKADKQLEAWAVQVGTFSQEANALVLQDKLRADNQPAYVTEVAEKDGNSFKVRVGPIARKQDAEKLKDKIKKSHKIEGYIVKHP